jgi:hypothetical protein
MSRSPACSAADGWWPLLRHFPLVAGSSPRLPYSCHCVARLLTIVCARGASRRRPSTAPCVEGGAAAPTMKAQRLQIPVTGSQGACGGGWIWQPEKSGTKMRSSILR